MKVRILTIGDKIRGIVRGTRRIDDIDEGRRGRERPQMKGRHEGRPEEPVEGGRVDGRILRAEQRWGQAHGSVVVENRLRGRHGRRWALSGRRDDTIDRERLARGRRWLRLPFGLRLFPGPQDRERCLEHVFVELGELEALPSAEEGAVLEHVEGGRVEGPVGALPGAVGAPWDLDEAVVEGEVVPQGVLPALGVAPVVREALRDEAVDVREGQHLLRRAPDRHRREGDVRVGGLLVAVRLATGPRHRWGRLLHHFAFELLGMQLQDTEVRMVI